jgi:hypothetical protein
VCVGCQATGLAVELLSSTDISGGGDDSETRERKGSIRMDRKAGNGCAIQSSVLAIAATHTHSTSGCH